MWIAIRNAVGARQGVGGGPGPGPGPGPLPYTPPMDAYPADIAYSVRKLSSSYSGPCMEVQRVVDAATLDIGFDSNGLLDTQAIIDFVVAGGGAQEARIRTWYDQTGNSRHALQTIGSEMSYIYGSGSIREVNGKPVVDPIYGGDGLYYIQGTYSTASNNTIFTVISPGLTGGSYVMSRYSGAFTQGILGAGIEEPISGWNANIDFGFGTTQYYRDGALYGSGTTLLRNDIMQSVLASRRIMGIGFTQSGLTEPLLRLGRDSSSSIYATQEYIVYFSDQLGTVPRTALEGNINSYYQVANLPDYTSGLLADYSGAAAAYSVRKLSNTAIKCMRVRRTVAPFDEQDIGFTAGGDLDEAAISTFGGSDPLVVSRWYDQSGFSRHIVQISPNLQPQIYNGTAVITDGTSSIPAIYFNGSNALESSSFTTVSQPLTVFHSLTLTQAFGGTKYMWSLQGLSGGINNMADDGAKWKYWYGGANDRGVGTSGIGQHLLTSLADGTDSTVWENGTMVPAGRQDAGSVGMDQIYLGGWINTTNQFDGYINEWIIYPTDQDAAGNRSGIETNINGYFSIYP